MIITVLLFTLLGNIVNVGCTDLSENPCNGSELFGLVCKMLVVLKRDAENASKDIEARFNALSDLQKNATKEIKMEIAKESKLLSEKHAADVKMLIGMIEEKIQSTSSVLQSKIEENRKNTSLKIDALSNTTKVDLLTLEDEVEKRIKNNTSLYQKSVEKLETEISEGKQQLNQTMQSEKAIIIKDYDSKIAKMNSFYQQNIVSVQQILQQEIQQNKQQIQDLYIKYNQVKISKWPAGKYCILRNGACPTGFQRIDGHMIAIKQYLVDHNRLKAANFGSSSIKCHGTCGQWGSFSELHLSTCCK